MEAASIEEGPGRLLRQSLPGPMFVPQKHVDPDAEGTSPIIPRGRKQCIPHSGQALSGHVRCLAPDMS
jgi:hypothetical protein